LVGFSKGLAGVDFRKDDMPELVHEIEPVTSRGDEVGDLARAFSNLATNLQSSVRNLIETETEKERMAGELSVASNIQMSMLSLAFPRFPEHKDIDVWAQLRPAREVGGDFYDFFFLDDHRFGFVVADVSGKGVPAALFMAVTMTLLKTNAQDITTTAVVIERINNQLSENNDECMFVTMFFGIIDLATGTVTYTNAGHNPPLLMRRSGEIVTLTGTHGPAVGAVGGIEYEQAEVRLNVDDKLLAFTDGVTEAFNLEGEAFGDDRLSALLERSGELGTKFLVNAVVDEVDMFAGDAEQFDDITVFCLRYVKRLNQ
jgi:sigma-B regulation protein RsbU (phosphoserine phosphatase)